MLDLLDTASDTIYWADAGFASPFSDKVEVTLPYGLTEYVNRTQTERKNNTGTGRTSINVVLSGRCDLIAPAGGKVLLAEKLPNVGNTLVIEHGAGVKTIYYGLRRLTVEKGAIVAQGDAPWHHRQSYRGGSARGQNPRGAAAYPARSVRCPAQLLKRSITDKAIPHNSKCRYGERGAADAKPKAQIILDAAKVSAASGGNSEPKQGQRSQSARGFCPRKHDAGTATRHYRAFWQRRCRAAAAGAVLKPQGGNCAVLP